MIGTRFSTELDTSQTPSIARVVVQEGIVEVRSSTRAPVRLTAGESLEVPVPTAAASDHPEPAADTTAPALAERARPAAPPRLLAVQLFEAAHSARGAGDVDAAARAYAALLKEYPADERVGVAALELGRLRMDSQHSYGLAAQAFRRAVAAAPNEGVREDATARLVEALEALHDRAACKKEQERYLARYPKGLHATTVIGRCQ